MNLPPYADYPVLYSDRVTLRKVEKADLPHLVEVSFYNAKPAENEKEAEAMQASIDRDYTAGNTVHWAIEETETGRVAGTCGFYRGFENRAGELGCVLLPQYRGHGYMSASLRLVIAFGFGQMNLHRIWAATSEDNAKAVRLLENLSFSRFKGSTEHGEIIYAILRSETI